MLITFTDLIILSTIGLSGLLLVVQFVSGEQTKVIEWNGASWLVTTLGVLCLVSTGVLLVLSFLVRGDTWFIIRIISLTIISFYALFKKSSPVIPLYLFINVVSSSIAPMISLGFSAGETDQIGHVLAANFVLLNHHFPNLAQQTAFGNAQYYNLFPIVDILISSTSLISGANVFLSLAIIQAVLPILVTFVLVAFSYWFLRNYLPAVIAVLIFLATDRLALWVLIPQNLSAVYCVVALLCLFLFFLRPSTAIAILVLIFSIFANFAHASLGGFLLATLLVAALVFRWQKIAFESKISQLALGVIVAIASYWTIWNISVNVEGNIHAVLESFVNAFSGKAATAVGASRSSLIALITPYNFLSWAVAPALAFSYCAYYLLTHRFRLKTRFDTLLIVSTAVGFVILGVGLFSTFNQGSAALERYADVPAYLVMMISGSVGAFAIIRSGRKSLVFLIIGFLVLSLAVGSISLDWSPDQINSTFGYVNQQQFTTSHSLVTLLPSSIVISFVQKLGYVNYWNNTKARTFVVPAAYYAISANRSTSTEYLVSFAEHSHTSVYYTIGPSLITDYNNLTDSPSMDFVFSNGQYMAIESYG